MPKLPEHLIGETNATEESPWILRTKWPRTLIRVTAMVNGANRVIPFHFDNVTGQPAGKLSKVYQDACRFLARATGDIYPTQAPEVLTVDGLTPPEFLILDEITDTPVQDQTFILITLSDPALIRLDRERNQLQEPVWPEPNQATIDDDTLRKASAWLKDYNIAAAKEYLGE